MRNHAGFLAIAVAAGFVATAAGAADKVQIGAEMAFPESVTSTADGALYAGSLTMGVIYKAAPGAAKAETWVDKQADGPQAISGVWADEKTGLLWACYADLNAFSGKGMPSVLRSIDLASGSIKGSYPFPDASFCNDMVATADGTLLVTDTAGSRIMQLKPGAAALENWLQGESLAGVDGISIGGDGAVYVNSVMANTLMRVETGADGSARKVIVLTLSEPIKGPDGMRFGEDGVLYLAENGAGRVDAVTIAGDAATIKVLKDGLDAPTAVTKAGNTLWALEAKIGKLGGKDDPGLFYVWPVELGQ
jgi:sugar lactone lactonase YvrE